MPHLALGSGKFQTTHFTTHLSVQELHDWLHANEDLVRQYMASKPPLPAYLLGELRDAMAELCETDVKALSNEKLLLLYMLLRNPSSTIPEETMRDFFSHILLLLTADSHRNWDTTILKLDVGQILNLRK